MSAYFLPFAFSFLLATGLLSLVLLLPHRFFPVVRKEPGRAHKAVSRFGGIALALAFLTSVVANPDLEATPQLVGLLMGTALVLFIGAWDDIVPIGWPAQLLFQLVLALCLFLSGMRAWVVTNPFGEPLFLHPDSWFLPSFLVGLVFTLLVVNAVNWADGVDGLLGGVAVVAFSAIFLVSLRPEVNQPTVAILAAILAGLSLSFLLFNFPKASLMAGTAGSYFIGFSVAALSLFAGAKIATTLLVLAVPVLDAAYVIRARVRAGVSPFRGGDGRHLHDRLRLLGWSDRAIASLYTGISAFAAFAALSFQTAGKFLFLAALAAAFVFIVSKMERVIDRRS